MNPNKMTSHLLFKKNQLRYILDEFLPFSRSICARIVKHFTIPQQTGTVIKPPVRGGGNCYEYKLYYIEKLEKGKGR